jgi:hypothetical protein
MVSEFGHMATCHETVNVAYEVAPKTRHCGKIVELQGPFP